MIYTKLHSQSRSILTQISPESTTDIGHQIYHKPPADNNQPNPIPSLNSTKKTPLHRTIKQYIDIYRNANKHSHVTPAYSTLTSSQNCRLPLQPRVCLTASHRRWDLSLSSPLPCMLPCVEVRVGGVDGVEGYRLGIVRDLSFCRSSFRPTGFLHYCYTVFIILVTRIVVV
jgi:hypothetical protein